jgi:hypothetical protein
MFDEKPRAERASAPTYSENCMVYGCKEKTVLVIWVNGSPITRCCACYDKDLRRAEKQQLKVDETQYRRADEGSLRGKLASVLKELINAKRAA